jgi:hypothetical protein
VSHVLPRHCAARCRASCTVTVQRGVLRPVPSLCSAVSCVLCRHCAARCPASCAVTVQRGVLRPVGCGGGTPRPTSRASSCPPPGGGAGDGVESPPHTPQAQALRCQCRTGAGTPLPVSHRRRHSAASVAQAQALRCQCRTGALTPLPVSGRRGHSAFPDYGTNRFHTLAAFQASGVCARPIWGYNHGTVGSFGLAVVPVWGSLSGLHQGDAPAHGVQSSSHG